MDKKEILRLLRKDSRWTEVNSSGARLAFMNGLLPPPDDYLVIHHHPGNASCDPKTLRGLLDQICWTEVSLRQMKAIR